MSEKPGKDTAVDDALTQRARLLFNESVSELDGDTRSHLNKGRQQALAAAPTDAVQPLRRLLPAAATAAAAVAALLVWTGHDPVDTPVARIAATDFELLLEQENLDMIEDLEFYSWIEPDNAVPDDVG